jgi:uncharacterized membrane protein
MSCCFVVGALWLTSASFWLHFIFLLILVAGFVMAVVRRSKLEENALRREAFIIGLGPLFFAAPLALFGMQHFALQEVVVNAVPDWMPGHFFWVWLVGTALIAASLSIITGRIARWAALLVALMLFLFVLMIYVPNAARNPSNRFAFVLLLRDLALSGGALCLSATLVAETNPQIGRWLKLAGRYFFGVPMLVFGVEHFLHPYYAPGVPLNKMMPAWIHGQVVWAWLTGAILLVGGLSILFNRRGSLAAATIGLCYLVLVLLVYLPMEFAHPSIEISGELDYVADTLAFSGAALLVAGSLAASTTSSVCAGLPPPPTP